MQQRGNADAGRSGEFESLAGIIRFELRARRRPNREEKGDLAKPDRRARRPQGPMA
ncbi:MAG: hypothetical protein HW408_935 [Actinobacteria bacterium]|nr:hypothetical protein [Actinomycetota bacterium]